MFRLLKRAISNVEKVTRKIKTETIINDFKTPTFLEQTSQHKQGNYVQQALKHYERQ